MAILFKDAFATYWGTKKEADKYVAVSISTGDKQQDGSYVNSNWLATLVGKALDKSENLEKGDKIRISGKVSTRYDKENEKVYNNVLVWDFDFSDSSKNDVSDEADEGIDDEEMPF
jgi:hypothetical protein